MTFRERMLLLIVEHEELQCRHDVLLELVESSRIPGNKRLPLEPQIIDLDYDISDLVAPTMPSQTSLETATGNESYESTINGLSAIAPTALQQERFASAPSVREATLHEHKGSLLEGEIILRQTLTVAEAKEKVLTMPDCRGFAYRGEDSSEAVEVIFTNHSSKKVDVDDLGHASEWTSYHVIDVQDTISWSHPKFRLLPSPQVIWKEITPELGPNFVGCKEIWLHRIKGAFLQKVQGQGLLQRFWMLADVWWHFSNYVKALESVEYRLQSSEVDSIGELIRRERHCFFDQFDANVSTELRVSATTRCDLLKVLLLMLAFDRNVYNADKRIASLLGHRPPEVYLKYQPFTPWKAVWEGIDEVLQEVSEQHAFRQARLRNSGRQTLALEKDRLLQEIIHPDWLCDNGLLAFLRLPTDTHTTAMIDELWEDPEPFVGVLAYFSSFLADLSGIIKWKFEVVRLVQAKFLHAVVALSAAVLQVVLHNGGVVGAYDAVFRGQTD